MFDTDLDRDSSPVDPRRRALLGFSLSAVSGLLVWSIAKPRWVQAAMPKGSDRPVTIVEFSDSGHRLRKLQVPKLVKSEEQWRQQLSADAFAVTRRADTERSFSGEYWNLHDKGLYRCICCDNALFSSDTKFESGTGWPSFWEPIAQENVHETRDRSLGMTRTEVSCVECDAHLGHVFDDGPEPTHLRYCMNSVALRFVKRT